MFTLTFHRPGSPEYDAARAGFDRAAIPTPELTLTATSDTDVVTAVRYAADHDLPVAVRATGHGPVAGVDGGMRRISAWVALVAVDTVITGIYGMNFDYMPELHHRYAYFICLAVMLGLDLTLYRLFRRSGWL